jgi:hypothetical protein
MKVLLDKTPLLFFALCLLISSCLSHFEKIIYKKQLRIAHDLFDYSMGTYWRHSRTFGKLQHNQGLTLRKLKKLKQKLKKLRVDFTLDFSKMLNMRIPVPFLYC